MPNQLPVVVFDMDDTLCHFVAQLTQVTERLFGVKVNLKTIHPNWAQNILTPEQFEVVLKTVFTEEVYMNLEPRHDFNDVKVMLLHFRGRAKFSVLTARAAALGPGALRITKAYLDKHGLGQHFDHVIISHPSVPKSEYLPKNTVLVFDDSDHVFYDITTSAKGKGVVVGVIDQPWNHCSSVSPPHMRVYGLPDMYALIEAAIGQGLETSLI